MTLATASAARMHARMLGRLHEATLTRPANSVIDVNDPTAAPTGTATTDPCEGYAFDYELRDIDGTRIMKGDVAIVFLRGTLVSDPQPGDLVAIPPPGGSSAQTFRVIAIEAITEAFVTVQARGAPTPAPTPEEDSFSSGFSSGFGG